MIDAIERIMLRCGKCGKEYNVDEYVKLKMIKAVETDTNPKSQHGYIPVCSCGYIFHRDKWRKLTKVPLGIGNVVVSTVDLEMDFMGYWYETMVFSHIHNKDCNFQRRYKTKAQAEKGHNKIVKLLEENKYKIVPAAFEIIIEDD